MKKLLISGLLLIAAAPAFSFAAAVAQADASATNDSAVTTSVDDTGSYDAYATDYSVPVSDSSPCMMNGQAVPCGDLPWFISFLLVTAPFMVLGCFLFGIVLLVIPMWIIYGKAGKPGWASIIPFYNIIVLLEITGKPVWWILLYFIPFVNIVMMFITTIELARVFGKGTGFALGMIFFPFIFYPILGFGSSTYIGNGAPVMPQTPPQMPSSFPPSSKPPYTPPVSPAGM